MVDDVNQGLPPQRSDDGAQNKPVQPVQPETTPTTFDVSKQEPTESVEQKKEAFLQETPKEVMKSDQPTINRFDKGVKKDGEDDKENEPAESADSSTLRQSSGAMTSSLPSEKPVEQSVKSVQPVEKPIEKPAVESVKPVEQSVKPVAEAVKPEAVKPEAVKTEEPLNQKPLATVQGKEDKKKELRAKKKKNAILGIVVIFFVLFVLGMILLVLMLAQNPQSNPLLELLGIEPSSLKLILGSIVNGVFGFLAFIALIFTTIGVFKVWTAPKGDKSAKKKAVVMSAIGAVLTVVIIFIWVVLYFYISQLRVGVRVYSGIITDPTETTQLTAPVQVIFSAAGIRERYRASTIIAYNWDFDGDGKYEDGSGEEIAHTFEDKGENNGIFNVGVEVIFAKGKPIMVSKQLTVSNILPEVKFKASPGLKGFTPFEVTFNAGETKDPDGSIVKYEWDFDDDARYDAEGEEVVFTFEEAGSHRVLLQVMDNNGSTATHEEFIEVEKSEKTEVVIDTEPGLEGMAPLEITFDGSRSVMPRTQIQSYKWSFGDGSKDQRGRTVKYTYNKSGSYTVALEVAGDDGRKESSVVTVVVATAKTIPVAVIATEPEVVDGVISGDAPLAVKFSASDSLDSDENIVEYQWSFSDEEVIDEYGEEVSHTFNKAGEYTVTLRVVDADENIGVTTLTVKADEPGLIGKVIADPLSGIVPLDVSFDASGSFVTDDSEIVAYRYDFGDGTPSTSGSAKQTHRYSEEGSFIAQVTVVTNTGAEEILEIYVNILAVPLQSKFDYRPKSGLAPLKVFFDATESTGDITSYSWSFGDGGISKVKSPEHVFDEAGTYEVELEVQDVSRNISNFSRNIIVE